MGPGNRSPIPADTDLDLAAGVVGLCEVLAKGHRVQGRPVSEIFEDVDKVGAHRLGLGVIKAPDGHRHVRGAGVLRQL